MNFNDEIFEGVVLKIGQSFMITNPEIEAALKEFHKALENAKFSTADPQYHRNLYELENYKTKREDRLARTKVFEESKCKQNELYDKYISLEIIPLILKNKIEVSESDVLTIGDDEYNIDDYSTRTGIKKHIIDKIKSIIVDKESFINFCKYNRIFFNENDLNPLTNYKNIVISADKWGNLRISCPMVFGQIYERNKQSNEIQWREIKLNYDWKLNKFTTGLNYTFLPQVFDEYELVGEQLVKIK